MRFVVLAVLLAACTAPTAAPPSTSPSASSVASPMDTSSPTPPPTASPTASPSPVAFAGAGLETFGVGPLVGEVAWVIRPVQPRAGRAGTADDRELWAVPLDGRPAKLAVRFRTPQVGTVVDANVIDRQLSPDGKRVVLSVGIGEVDAVPQLEVIDLESGRVTPLLPGSRAFAAAHPAWSPDGARIAWVRWPYGGAIDQREIWVAGADGKDPRRLREAVGRGTFVRLYRWLPDSRRIAFDPLNFETSELAVIDLGGAQTPRAERLHTGHSAALPLGVRERAPRLAMATVDSPFNPTRYELVVADDVASAGRAAVVLRPGVVSGQQGLAAPRWSPAGRNVLLYRVTGSESTTVVLDLDTGTSLRVGSRVKAAEWTPDGTRFVTIEEHPSTAADRLYVWTAGSGKLLAEGLRIPGEPMIYGLTDLAVRTY